jgi:DNA polymerase-2
MIEADGWLLEVFAHPQDGAVLWFLDEDGERRRLRQEFPVTFYAAGPAPDLRALWRFLESQPLPVVLERVERRDLFLDEPLTLMSIQVAHPARQPELFRRVSRQFPQLTYYDADLPLSLRHAAAHDSFPLARCHLTWNEVQEVESITVLDSPWDLDHALPPLRILSLEPNRDPGHARPDRLRLRIGRASYHLDLEPPRPLLINLRAILRRHDPDLLLTVWGDTWLFPYLIELSGQWGIPLPLNREADMEPEYHRERSYFTYGQVIHRGRQVHLFGRWHVDGHNAMLFNDYGLEGALEMARVTALPLQTAARVSPGSGISAMQMVTALRKGVLIPWHKQQAERPKSALALLRSDQGGLVYQPRIGLHPNVAEIDFISMYPSIMVHFNISPETVAPPGEADSQESDYTLTELGIAIDLARRGLVPETLKPLLDKRVRLKEQLGVLPAWHPKRKAYTAHASAHKWLLVTCFGYLGYKNARFGRIEAHEAVTAYGREILLSAKEAAEEEGFTVLHLYVDGLWVCKQGAESKEDFQPLLDRINERTGLPIALDGIYRWVAFLPSRQDSRVPVANRYFGVFQDGSLKLRGIEARRRDTPPFIVEMQMEVLERLSKVKDVDRLPGVLPWVVRMLRKEVSRLRRGQIAPERLLVAQKLSRELEAYTSPSPVARAVAQLQAVGKVVKPGQRVRFLYTRGNPGVHAWDLPAEPDLASLDVDRYIELMLRAAFSILQPLGVREATLRNWVLSNAAYLAPPGKLPQGRSAALPLWAAG